MSAISAFEAQRVAERRSKGSCAGALPLKATQRVAERRSKGEIRLQDGRRLCRVVSNVLNPWQEAV